MWKLCNEKFHGEYFLGIILIVAYNKGPLFFWQSGSHLKILSAKKMTWSKL